MKQLTDGSTCWRNHSRVAVVLVIFVFFSLTLLTLPPCKADDQASKAMRRAFSDQRRVALVIGNDDYKVGPLQNPAHDAEDVTASGRL